MRSFTLLLFLLSAFVLSGCPDDASQQACCTGGPPLIGGGLIIGPDPYTTPDPDGGAPANVTVSGQVTFERLPVTSGGLGAVPTAENAAFVPVEVLSHDDYNTPIAVTVTDASGAYTVNFSTTKDFFVRARAQSGAGANIDRVYHQRTSGGPVVYAVSSTVLHRSLTTQTVNLLADTQAPHYRAGAFAVLDTVRRLRAAAAGSFASLGALDVFWCPENVHPSAPQNAFISATGTDLNGPNARPVIYLVGGAYGQVLSTDHDEFDETVIAHEWASFLQLTQSRDNNFGGVHFGEELIFSAAYSEGVVTAVGCALLGQQVYRDTVGYPGGTTGVQFEFDCETGLVPGSGAGYGNEFRVTRATWDLFDGGVGSPADTDADPSNIAMGDFLSSFADLRTRGAPFEIAWLASLLQELIDDAHLGVSTANTIMATHGASFPPAGGDAFPPVLNVGGATEFGNLDAWSGADPNPILGPQANGLWRIELAGAQTITINVTNTTPGYNATQHRLDLTLHDLDRNILAQHVGDATDKSVSISLTGGTYLVRVQHVPATQADSGATSFMVQAQ